jgi:glycerol uptake facilitator-like aquaporin
VSRRAAAEFVGTLFLLAAVVGSGILGERLSGGDVAPAHEKVVPHQEEP